MTDLDPIKIGTDRAIIELVDKHTCEVGVYNNNEVVLEFSHPDAKGTVSSPTCWVYLKKIGTALHINVCPEGGGSALCAEVQIPQGKPIDGPFVSNVWHYVEEEDD